MPDSAQPGSSRRRRVRPRREADDAAGTDPAASDGSGEPAPRRPAKGGRGERGLRNLVGAGPSQVGVQKALRARDVNRPSAADLAEAERDLEIVRRHWKPPDPR